MRAMWSFLWLPGMMTVGVGCKSGQPTEASTVSTVLQPTSAPADNPTDYFSRGLACEEGKGVPQDYTKAIELPKSWR